MLFNKPYDQVLGAAQKLSKVVKNLSAQGSIVFGVLGLGPGLDYKEITRLGVGKVKPKVWLGCKKKHDVFLAAKRSSTPALFFRLSVCFQTEFLPKQAG